TSIIHYKGESTSKSSLNYILTFYQAMLIFTKKHPEFKGQRSLIRSAIYFQGLMTLIRQIIRKWWPALIDIVLCAASFYIISMFWEHYYFHQPGYFNASFF